MARLKIKVTPNASKNAVGGFENGVLKLKITAPPVDGKANEAVLKFLAEWLGVRKNTIHLLAGETSREKTFEIQSLSEEELQAFLLLHGGIL